jgi:hypothetical protein
MIEYIVKPITWALVAGIKHGQKERSLLPRVAVTKTRERNRSFYQNSPHTDSGNFPEILSVSGVIHKPPMPHGHDSSCEMSATRITERGSEAIYRVWQLTDLFGFYPKPNFVRAFYLYT